MFFYLCLTWRMQTQCEHGQQDSKAQKAHYEVLFQIFTHPPDSRETGGDNDWPSKRTWSGTCLWMLTYDFRFYLVAFFCHRSVWSLWNSWYLLNPSRKALCSPIWTNNKMVPVVFAVLQKRVSVSTWAVRAHVRISACHRASRDVILQRKGWEDIRWEN